MKTKVKLLTLLGLGFCFGLAAVFTNYSNLTGQRDPAAINAKVFQLSNLSSIEIKSQIQKKLKVMPTVRGQKNIALNGFSSALCKTYSIIEMEFAGEGISVAGEPPVMKISYPCTAGQDPAEIAPMQLAVKRLMGEKPRNASFKFDGYNSTVILSNAADEWPQQWILKQVQFKNENGNNKQVSFDRSPASINEEPPIVLEF